MTDFEKTLKDRILAGENPQDMLKKYTAALEAAQQGIKADQEAKQADKVNGLAQRLLKGEVTHDDIALVYSTYMKKLFSERGQELTEKDLEEFRQMVDASMKQLEGLFDALVELEKQVAASANVGVAVTDMPVTRVKIKGVPDTAKAADEIIRKFVDSIT